MRDKISIGDSCKVVYARSNPEISEILQSEDKKLKVFRQYRGASPIKIQDYDSINLKKEFSKYDH
ncbi:MAG TPA: hypothetical protein VHO28_09385 [Ignavibacteriales bacterium]|nr:hypothetical protein [Ignavibacteriales bacterium]